MSDFDRRQFLKGILGKLAVATGTVVLASTATPLAGAPSAKAEGTETPPEDIQKRADRLAAAESSAAEAAAETNEFLNGAFRNTPWGGFGNSPIGSFRNTPMGVFRNAPLPGWRNTPVVGPFGNGGWNNFFPGGFRNGGWPNSAWRNWW